MKNSKFFLKRYFGFIRPIYHGVYFLFVVLESCACWFYFNKNDDFIEWCNSIGCCGISEQIATFSSMMGMQAICTAIIIFLYSKYNEGAQGIRSEYFIEFKMGKKTVSIYRITSLVLPCISVIFYKLQWYGAAIVGAAFLYYIIAVYVLLISVLMRRDKISKLIRKMVQKEILYKETNLSSYIMKEVSGGFFIIVSEKSKWLRRKRERIKLQSKSQIYQELKSDIIDWVFNENSKYELDLTVKDICEELSDLSAQNIIVNYIFMYELVTNILITNLEISIDWKLAIIDRIFVTLDSKSSDVCLNYSKMSYEVLYFAVVCSILQHGNDREKDYLWFGFFEKEKKRNPQIAKSLFVLSLGFMELLRRTNTIDTYLVNIIQTHRDKLSKSLNFIGDFFNEYKDFNKKYSVALSLIGCETQYYIEDCYKDIQNDLINIGNKDYYMKTFIRTI